MSLDWPRLWDLNMEEDLLEAWGVSDGIRELLANALDEYQLTDTEPPEVWMDEEKRWHIRDYGRGLEYEDFAQGEDQEKLDNADLVIGKFGVGLKDALAVLYRLDVDVTIHSPHNTFRVREAAKAEFDDVETLHSVVHQPERPDIEGTEIILDGCTETDIEEAKDNFLFFSNISPLETTSFGEVFERPKEGPAEIYVTGLKVATEGDFLFSYNITNTTKNIRDALNRERSNVGRTAYTPRVKKILQECSSAEVAQRLIDDLKSYQAGDNHDELNWKPIRVHAAMVLNATTDAMFVTANERASRKDLIERAESDGIQVVTVPDDTREELQGAEDTAGGLVRDVDVFEMEWQESFEFEFVDEGDLTESERETWHLRNRVLEIANLSSYVDGILLSETMRTLETGWKTYGLWEPSERRIIIKREALGNEEQFIGILLHEAAHALSPGAEDQSREFEKALTDLLGVVGRRSLD